MPSSPADSPDHLLLVFIKEPIEGRVNTHMVQSAGEKEAHRRYKAMCGALLDQLIGLKKTRVRFCVTPEDAIDAVKFWILPQLAGDITPLTNETFLLSPEKAAASIELEFVANNQKQKHPSIIEQQKLAFEQGYALVSTMGTSCPDCGSRWLQMATMLCKNTDDVIIGKDAYDSVYLTTVRSPHFVKNTNDVAYVTLPNLPKIKTDGAWKTALESPIGGKLKAHYKKNRY